MDWCGGVGAVELVGDVTADRQTDRCIDLDMIVELGVLAIYTSRIISYRSRIDDYLLNTRVVILFLNCSLYHLHSAKMRYNWDYLVVSE